MTSGPPKGAPPLWGPDDLGTDREVFDLNSVDRVWVKVNPHPEVSVIPFFAISHSHPHTYSRTR